MTRLTKERLLLKDLKLERSRHQSHKLHFVACRWGEALAVLQAEPTALLRMCQLRREFALGGQAVRRFALPEAEACPWACRVAACCMAALCWALAWDVCAEVLVFGGWQVAALQLSEWLDACVAGASVDAAVSQLAARGADSGALPGLHGVLHAPVNVCMAST